MVFFESALRTPGALRRGALSLAELLAIILRTGTRGDNALELANKLLSKHGGYPDGCGPISASCAPSTA
jgi:hypothetical protein